jgi:hypothetical protein
MRSFAIFCIVAGLHFALSVAGFMVALPAAFAYQEGFWKAPGQITLAWIGGVLLAPMGWVLPGNYQWGFTEIAATSVVFGLAAVGIARLFKALK